MSKEEELTRIQREYVRRVSDRAMHKHYGVFNPVALRQMQGLERALLYALTQQGVTQLATLRILDVGCGHGHWLGHFLSYGALPENLFGIDLLANRIASAQRVYPSPSVGHRKRRSVTLCG